MEVVRRILEGESVPRLAEELGIHRKLLYQWLRQVNEGGEANLRPRGRPRKGAETKQMGRQMERTTARQRLMTALDKAQQASRVSKSRNINPILAR